MAVVVVDVLEMVEVDHQQRSRRRSTAGALGVQLQGPGELVGDRSEGIPSRRAAPDAEVGRDPQRAVIGLGRVEHATAEAGR